MLSAFTPPSISRRMSLPVLSIIARTARSLSSADGMKACPPKPGFTDISSTRSSSGSTQSSTSTGVPGLSTRPALQPSDLISWMVRCTCFEASGWKLMMLAPASAKSGTMRSTGSTIRCTSIGAVTPCLRSALHTIGPMVRLGT